MKKQHRFSVGLGAIFAVAFGLLASTSAFATTYTYTSPNYTGTLGTNTPPVYTTAMHLTGSFTTASPLPPNMPVTTIGSSGSNLVHAWNFFDGLHTYSASNTRLAADFQVSTDAAGNIQFFGIVGLSPLPPNTVGQKMNGFGASPNNTLGVSNTTCITVDVSGRCTDTDGAVSADSYAQAPAGTFTTGATPAGTLTATPNPAQPGQAVVLTATTSSSSIGTVTFLDGTTVLCNAVPLASGSATCSTSSLSLGAHTITANFVVGGIAVITFSATTQVTIAAIPPVTATPAPTLGAWTLAMLALSMLLIALAWQRKGMRR